MSFRFCPLGSGCLCNTVSTDERPYGPRAREFERGMNSSHTVHRLAQRSGTCIDLSPAGKLYVTDPSASVMPGLELDSGAAPFAEALVTGVASSASPHIASANVWREQTLLGACGSNRGPQPMIAAQHITEARPADKHPDMIPWRHRW